MRQMLIDTDILSRFFRGDEFVIKRVAHYASIHQTLHIGIISQYEILSGLYHKDAQQQLKRFLAFLPTITVLDLNEAAIEHAAQCYAQTRKLGTPVDDMDLLIAGIALANNMGVVTHNTAHFSKIQNLYLEDWALANGH